MNGLARLLLMQLRMNSRISWLALAVFVVGCGTGGEQDEGRARDPVVFCSGLSRAGCEAAPECYVEPLACITLCVDPGDGSCGSACPSDFRCLARPTTCESLSPAQCQADSRCEFFDICLAVCIDDGFGGCRPCPTSCRTRTPVACEQLDVNACVTDARCEVVSYACTLECRDDGHGGCLPCNAPPDSCRTRPPTPVACAGLDYAACIANPNCESKPLACPAVCIDDGHGGCVPCDPAVECVERGAAPSCYGLSVDACVATDGCELLSPVCACPPNAPDCACLPIAPTCVPSNPPVSCYGMTPDVCAQHAECEFVSRDVCDCVGANCTCPVIEPSCQPRATPPVLCFGLDPQACSAQPGCAFIQRTCGPTEDCAYDGYCAPRTCEGLDAQVCINTPGCGLLESDCAGSDCGGSRCVEVEPTPNPCVGLSVDECTQDARCEIGSLVCTTECRDDGHGGCLPCPDTAVCQLRNEEPVIGCGGGQP